MGMAISEFRRQIRKALKGGQLQNIAGTHEHGQTIQLGEGSSADASRFATALQPRSMHLASIARTHPTLHSVLSGHGQLVSKRPNYSMCVFLPCLRHGYGGCRQNQGTADLAHGEMGWHASADGPACRRSQQFVRISEIRHLLGLAV